jgi:RNA polymerase sigma factor (sigma-70 family)
LGTRVYWTKVQYTAFASGQLIKPGSESMSTGDPLADRDRADFDTSAPRKAHKRELGDLYREIRDQWLRILTARTGSRHEAKEVLQEAFAKMLELDRPDTAGFLKAYLWKLAVNLVKDRRKQQATQARLAPMAAQAQGPEKFAPSREELLHEQQCLTRLEKAIDTLERRNPDWFSAFVLHVQHGLTFKEVGRRLNVAERTAQFYVSRALEYCHEDLDNRPPTGGNRNE